MELRDQVNEFYRIHNPERLGQPDILTLVCKYYATQPDLLWTRLAQKYHHLHVAQRRIRRAWRRFRSEQRARSTIHRFLMPRAVRWYAL